MKKTLFLLQMLFLYSVGIAQGSVLFTESWNCGGIPLYQGIMTFRMAGSSGTNTLIFDDLALTLADAGKTFSAKPDPDYSNFVSMITNDIDDPLFFSIGVLLWGGKETQRWFHSSPPPGRVDFQGYQIDDITVQFDSKTVADPTPHQSWDTCTFTIIGQPIPEPATLSLSLLGGLPLVRWQKR